MEMRKFIVEIHPDGTVHATEYEDRVVACVYGDEPKPEVRVYKRIIEYCETMIFLMKGNADKVDAYNDVIITCKHLGNLL